MEVGKTIEEEVDQGAINIFLFSNGQEYSPPRKYHLQAEELAWWDATLSYLARSQYGSMHSGIELYTLDGSKLESPDELKNYAVYVAVVPPDAFIQAGYDKYLLKASRSWEKRQSKRNSTIEQALSVDKNTKEGNSKVDADKRKDSTNAQTINQSIPLEALVTNNVEDRSQRNSMNIGRKVNEIRKISVVSKPAERRRSTPYQVSQRPNTPRRISNMSPVELTTKKIPILKRETPKGSVRIGKQGIPGKILNNLTDGGADSSFKPIRMQEVLHKVNDKNKSYAPSKTWKPNNASKIESAINEVKAQLRDNKPQPVTESLQSKEVINNTKAATPTIVPNSHKSEITSITVLGKNIEIMPQSDIIQPENEAIISKNNSKVPEKNSKDTKKDSLPYTTNSALISNVSGNCVVPTASILNKISKHEPSEMTNYICKDIKIESGDNKQMFGSIVARSSKIISLPVNNYVNDTKVENQIVNSTSSTKSSKPINNVTYTKIIENDCNEIYIEPSSEIRRYTEPFLVTPSNDVLADMLNESKIISKIMLSNSIDIPPVKGNIVNNLSERTLLNSPPKRESDINLTANLVDNKSEVKKSGRRNALNDKMHAPRSAHLPSDDTVENVYKKIKSEISSTLTESDSYVRATEKHPSCENENKEVNTMPLVMFQSTTRESTSLGQRKDYSESDFNKIVILVEKGDIVNFEFQIEVRNEEGILKKTKKVESRKSRSFSNLKKDDNKHDDNMLTQSKSLQSIVNECPPHLCCRKDQRVVVVNCSCCDCRSQEDTQNKLDTKALLSDIQPCYVLLPVVTPKRKCSKIYPNIGKTFEKQVQNTESLTKVNLVSSFKETIVALPSQRASIANTTDKLSVGSQINKDSERYEYTSKRQVSILSNDNLRSEVMIMKTDPSQASAQFTDNYASADCTCVNRRASLRARESGSQEESTQTDWCDVLLEARTHPDGRYTFHLPPLQVLQHYRI